MDTISRKYLWMSKMTYEEKYVGNTQIEIDTKLWKINFFINETITYFKLKNENIKKKNQ